jgi:hypothetical protein
MGDTQDPQKVDEQGRWHRAFAVGQFNGCWELIDEPDRSPDQDLEMVLRAMTSRWHWSRIGGAEEIAAGDWQVAHAASLVGWGDVAMTFASRNLAVADELGWSGWRLASAHEGMARAFATTGDRAARDRHVALAEEALASEPDVEDRDLIASQLATVP